MRATDNPAGMAELQDQTIRKATSSMEERWGALEPSNTFESVWGKYRSSAASRERRIKHKRNRKLAVSILWIVIFAGISAIFVSPEVRASLAQFPYMKMLLKDGGFEDIGLSKIEKDHLGVQVDQSVMDHGIRFKMDEVFYDGVQIVLNYDVEYLDDKKKMDEKDIGVYYDLNIEDGPEHMSWGGTHKFTQLSDRTFIGTTLFEADKYIDGKMLEMTIKQIGRVKGDWSVTVPLSVDKTTPHTRIFYPNVTFEVDGFKRMVERITFTPVSTQIVIKSEDKQDMRITYGLQDNLQTWLPSGGGFGGGGEFIGNFSPPTAINPNPEYIEILARKQVKITPQSTADTADLKEIYPVELAGEGGGSIKITNVEFHAGETIVYYEASDVDNQNPSLVLVNEKGEYHGTGQPERISKEKLLFKKKYPAMEADPPVQAKLYHLQYTPGEEPPEPVRILIPLDWSMP